MATIRVLWAATAFLGSGLLFVVQPMIAKMLLPRVGGAPAAWTTCVLFFQVALLAGYLYAHAVGRRGWRVQLAIHVVLLLSCLPLLPFAIVSGAPGAGPLAPALWVLRALALAIGLPFVVLAAGTPLLQRWLAGSSLPGSANPYVLYAASNAGSLAALAAYPFLIEPAFGLTRQAVVWSLGFALYGLLILACATLARRASRSVEARLPPAAGVEDEAVVAQPEAALPWPRWVALAAVPSSLMLGVTSLVTADAAGFPFLWVPPLALYLLTFVLAFARPDAPSGRWTHLVRLGAVAFLLLWMIKATEPLAFIVGAYLAIYFVAAMACHVELVRTRPVPSRLTAFYAWIGVGGGLGGLFNSVVAPVVFRDWLELPLAFALVCLLVPGRDRCGEAFRWADAAVAAGAFLLTAALVKIGDALETTGRSREVVTLALPALFTFLVSARRFRFGLTVGAVLLAGSLDTSFRGRPELTARSFFGVHRVTRADAVEGGKPVAYRKLYHGSTIHGVQHADPATGAPVRPREPLAYYAPDSPVGRLFRALRSVARPKRVGVVGLGAGSLLAYAEPGDRWALFEIDALVGRIAEDERFFTFLPDARKRGALADVVLGDARLTLAGSEGAFDVLVLDAFSSGSIPVHLLTHEALQLYAAKLAPGGVVACHVSNRHLDLGPTLRNTAEDLGLATTIDAELDPPQGGPAHVMGSRWVFLAKTNDALRARALPEVVWLSPRKRGPVWTDDRSDVLRLFRW